MDNEFICDACKKHLSDGEPYASIGGNIDPYIPAKLYHIQCIPTFKSEPSINIDDFEPCETCMVESYHRPQVATFVIARENRLHYYCEEHGTALNLSRGIPMNPAEHENKCSGCQAPLEDGTVCSDCAVHATLQKSAEFTKKFLESPEGIAALKVAGLRLNLDAFDKMLEDFLLPPYTPPETFGRAAAEASRRYSSGFCTKAWDQTCGEYTCTRETNHDGPCAAVPNQIGPKRFSGDWFRAHVDHFIISFMVGVPLLIANAIASNVFTHHAVQVLQALHIPETILHGLGY